jgi:23S rRNA pseudouridine2605 synthase
MSGQHDGKKTAPPSSGFFPEPSGCRPVRLNKALADAGVCSRRKADALIAQGRVGVNGRTVREPGLRVAAGTDAVTPDVVTVDGVPLPRAPARRVTLMLHKPVRVLSTVRDPQGRPTVLDLLPPRWRDFRLFPVGRLDFFSEGLLLLTNDGDFAQRLLHPRHHVPRLYHVLLRETPSDAVLRRMREGTDPAAGGVFPASAGARLLPSSCCAPMYFSAPGTLAEITLIRGMNRQIRRMCRELGLTILRLARVAQGPLRLGNLPAGKTRELTSDETAAL